MTCNRECENGLTCPHSDCISNEVSLTERLSQTKLDSSIKSDKPNKRRKRDKAKNRLYQSKHYAKNRDSEVERVREYNRQHVEERKAYARAYRLANLEKERERDRKRKLAVG